MNVKPKIKKFSVSPEHVLQPITYLVTSVPFRKQYTVFQSLPEQSCSGLGSPYHVTGFGILSHFGTGQTELLLAFRH